MMMHPFKQNCSAPHPSPVLHSISSYLSSMISTCEEAKSLLKTASILHKVTVPGFKQTAYCYIHSFHWDCLKDHLHCDIFHFELFWLALHSFPFKFLHYFLLYVELNSLILTVKDDSRTWRKKPTIQHTVCAVYCYCCSFPM